MVVEYTINNKDKTIKCVDFDGFIDQLNYIYSFIKNNTFNTAKEVDVSDDFYGSNNLLNTIEGMNYGFQKSTDYFLNCLEEVKKQDDSSDGVFMDYEGFAYDMGAFVSGEPECCLNMGLPTPTPYIKILVDISFPWYYSSTQIFNRGIAITNLVETLLINNYIVDLYAMEYNSQNCMDVMYTNKIDTRSLSISNIAFMSSPEYFRKIGFITIDKIRGKESEAGRGHSGMLGFMLNKIKKDKIFFISGGFTGASNTHFETPQRAIEWLLHSFNMYCVENKLNIALKNNNVDNTNI